LAILSKVSELITDVRDIINETTESFWTDVYITRQLEKGHQIASTKIKMVKMLWTVTLVTGTASTGQAQIVDDREILLPSTFISIDDGGVYYNDDVCAASSIKQIKDSDEDWLERSGTPSRYYLRGDMLGFDNKISAADTVRIYGTKMPTELTGTQAPFDGDYRTVGYRYLLVDYAIGMCWKKKNEIEKFAFYLAPKVGSFWVGLAEMKSELLEDGDEGYNMITEDNPAHYHKAERWPDWSQFD
jgi:hypothetical protein